MIKDKKLLELLKKEHEIADKDFDARKSITTGIVVDADDPLQSGRLRIFCPNLNDDPKKVLHLPWAVYMSPFGGVTSNESFARGTGKHPENTNGATAYGFWAIPEVGSKVLVTCINGDERKRVWLGCLHEHQETHTLFHGRYDWEGGGKPDGPLSSKKGPIEPLYTNTGKAFNDDRESREWKTRQAEYQTTAVNNGDSAPNNEKGDYVDNEYEDIFNNEQDDWVKPIVGAHGYDWSGNKALGSHMTSRVFGLSTPGLHALSMDDRAFNSRIRLRSATGHNIIMDDTNERIYIATNEGANWIELDSSGNIDIYSKRRISVHAEKDINFSTDESFRVKAKKGIHMYSGDTKGQHELDDEKPEDGEIRFHSTADTHFMVEKNMRTLIKDDWLTEVGGKVCTTVGEGLYLQVEKEINTIVNNGDYNISLQGDYNHNVSGNTSIFSGNDNIIQAVNNTNIFSFTGKMDIGSKLNMSLKTYRGNMTIEALSPKSSLKILSNAGANQFTMGNPSFSIFSMGELAMRSAKGVAQQINKEFGINSDKDPTYQGAPLDGCLRFNGGVNISFDTEAINLDAVDDIYGKVQKGIDGLTSPVDTTIGNINKSLDKIQDDFNDFVATMHKNWSVLDDIWGGWGDLDIVLPALPPFPQPPSLRFPALNLPQLPFDFCIEVAPLINVDRFDIIPHNLFGSFDADLGLLSKSQITTWVDRHKNIFSNSVTTFKNAIDTATSFQPAINNIKANVFSMKQALNNLVDVNVTLGNDTILASYTGGVEGFRDSVRTFNGNVEAYQSSGGTANINKEEELENAIDSHLNSLKAIEKNIKDDPSSVNSHDFSDMIGITEIISQYSIELEDI